MISKKKKSVFVGMSGGVDSSVAAFLLKKSGYDVTGVFIKCYNIDGCAERDAEDARRVAEHIGIPFYVFDFEKEYKKKVVDYMIEGYRTGLTPNPDVMCNREIKFGLFLKRALSLGADFVATGHYVELVSGKAPHLKIAKDTNKDQSYFLWTLTPNELKHCIFPLGKIKKPEVRIIAKKAGLSTAEKKDSQGICFLGMFDVKDFLKQKIKTKNGYVLGTDGEMMGEHEGAALYTIGQRHGFTLSAKKGSETKPHYVVSKDVKKNIIVVAEGSENPSLFRKELELSGVNIVIPFTKKASVMARVRYRQPISPAILENIGTKSKPRYKLSFKKSQKFVASGQSAVFYKGGGGLVGGGIIV
ncbi:MAG: tRNA 2-thiouridine(34) synthase MnmA [bacterium]|nr:tRNA 2-thiouridine(34) synthase MnmA [Candidatus Jorgensenbacteria bacterium]